MKKIIPKSMFLAMRDIFYGGEFSEWLNEQEMPAAALKEFEEAEQFFLDAIGCEYSEDGTLKKNKDADW